MKVLFVGEGPNELGHPEMGPSPKPAGGMLPILSKKAAPNIDPDCLAIFWREIPILPREGKKRGWAAKVAAAILLSWKNGLEGTVCVADNDRDDDRLPAMEEGIAKGIAALSESHAAVCGIAKESIESWTLGAVSALAKILRVDVAAIRKHYKISEVEDLYQKSGKPKKRPKDLLQRVAQLGNQNDSTAFREEVATETDIAELMTACPRGFRPFAQKLQSAFGP